MIPDFDWKQELIWLGPTPHIEAIGAFALEFNHLEFGLLAFFEEFLPTSAQARRYLFSQLHNRARVDLIRELVADDPEPAFAEGINYALKCFDLCAENRNLILHAAPGSIAEPGQINLVKTVAGRPDVLNTYAPSLDDLRQAAMSAASTSRYMFLLQAYAMWRRGQPLLGLLPPQNTLPERPPQPRKLSLSLRREASSDEPPPPQSSGV